MILGFWTGWFTLGLVGAIIGQLKLFSDDGGDIEWLWCAYVVLAGPMGFIGSLLFCLFG